MKEVILITGVTGFLGCHLGELLVENKCQVVATRRSTSSLKNCAGFAEKIRWINIDEANWKEQTIALNPTMILHAAWIGVAASERDDWELQSKNLVFLQELLYIAQQSNVKKIIALGSQAEYGFINTIVTETHPLKPTSAYGSVKIICSQLIKHYCIENSIAWYWLRVFSVFGEKEGSDWLLPAVIKTIAAKQQAKMDFSPGEQQYAYLYIKDFANAVKKVIVHPDNLSGFYNISSENPLPLKTVITLIRDVVEPAFVLEFGTLPYRQNQSMLIAGDMKLFNDVFGTLQTTPLNDSINNTINFYTSKV